MKKQAFNPYLPNYEYVPDGEPRLFGGRLYIYGSHDKFNGSGFCLNDYVCWSAPEDNLGEWKYEGVIYKKEQDPLNQDGKQNLYAPDAVKGPDGRYYLFYVLHLSTVISVAVSNTPAGKYEFYGHVRFPDGHIWGTKKGEANNFDPGVFIDDDGRIFVYSGFSPKRGVMRMAMKMRKRNLDGAFCAELERDMLTIKHSPALIVPGSVLAEERGFKEHPFFEASSLRKVNGRYYFIYSSALGHELCYAISSRLDGGFKFGGTLVSIGDIGFQGNQVPLNYLGNTHGSIIEILGNWYVFYHRQTNQSMYSRQGCAERIEILPDGRIPQVEVTSCGLNKAALLGTGEYEASISCNLSGADSKGLLTANPKKADFLPYFTQSGGDREGNQDQYIANLRDGAWAGFKYFQFDAEKCICAEIRGDAKGTLEVRTERGGDITAALPVVPSESWKMVSGDFRAEKGCKALYFSFKGRGALDFRKFTIL